MRLLWGKQCFLSCRGHFPVRCFVSAASAIKFPATLCSLLTRRHRILQRAILHSSLLLPVSHNDKFNAVCKQLAVPRRHLKNNQLNVSNLKKKQRKKTTRSVTITRWILQIALKSAHTPTSQNWGTYNVCSAEADPTLRQSAHSALWWEEEKRLYEVPSPCKTIWLR